LKKKAFTQSKLFTKVKKKNLSDDNKITEWCQRKKPWKTHA